MKSRVPASILEKFFRALCSLKLAILVILSLTIGLGVGTVLESLYDTQTAQYWVYRAEWFRGVLILLGINIFSVAVSRLPWKKNHLPFLLAHLGILILLLGSWITDRFGIDGSLRLTEGDTVSVVELDTAALVISENKQFRVIPIRWIPPGVSFKKISARSYGLPYDLEVDQFIPHADSSITFAAAPAPLLAQAQGSIQSPVQAPKTPALQVRIAGGVMKISQDLWLWQGTPAWQTLQAGPAQLSLGEAPFVKKGAPQIAFFPHDDGSLSYSALTSEGKKTQGKFGKGQWIGKVIKPGWKGDVSVSLSTWIPDATPVTSYRPSRVEYGPQAPASAIHLAPAQGEGVWLGLGDRAVLRFGETELEVGYFPRRILLPFSVHLDRFSIETDQGTVNPASYSSQVRTTDPHGQKEVTISMNEPLEKGGFTLYQASYEEGDPRPVTSILSVNQDPGRFWKYLGSFLIVLGSILLFAVKYLRSRRVPKNGVAR